ATVLSSLVIGDGIGALGGGVERIFERAPRRLERCRIGVARHPHRLAGHPAAAAERKIDRGAVPVAELHACPGRNRDWIDRPPGLARELDDAEPGDTRDLWNVGGERD